MNKYSELELKFVSSSSDIPPFLIWMMDEGPSKYLHVKCPDHYYRQGDNVVRHRLSEGAGELTCKLRKSDTSTTDRVEINLKFAEGMSYEDVDTFLRMSGWEDDLSLNKDAHVFWLEQPDFTTTVSIYNTYQIGVTGDRRTWIEVEIENTSYCSQEQGLAELMKWKKRLMDDFLLNEPINESLYEIYTGRKYLNVKE